MNDNLNSTYDTDMPDFSNAICLTEYDAQKALMQIVSPESHEKLKPLAEIITHLANIAYRNGLQAGYEIAIERQKGKKKPFFKYY